MAKICFSFLEKSLKKGYDGLFVEHAEVYGNLYGTSKKTLFDCLENFKIVFAIIDVEGAKVYKKMVPNLVSIFLRPGSIEDIKRRLTTERKSVSEEETKKRIATAEKEIAQAGSFDFVVDNVEGKFFETVDKVLKILNRCGHR